MAHYFLVSSMTYDQFEIGLFDGVKPLKKEVYDKRLVSEQITYMIDALLEAQGIDFTCIEAIITHVGPAPLMSLRTILSFYNGLHFATGVKLIGIDAIKSLLDHEADKNALTIALFNAFGKEAYYGIRQLGHPDASGCKPIDALIEDIKAKETMPIKWIGNGVEYFKHELACAGFTIDCAHLIQHASLGSLAQDCLKKYEINDVVNHLEPLYIKNIN